jgi:hypothetical protein
MSPDVPLATYDAALQARLAALPAGPRAAFAAACAERLQPAAGTWLQAAGPRGVAVRAALDLAWEGARSGRVASDEAQDLIERCRALLPGPGSADALAPAVEDAVAATIYALEAAAGLDERAAGWAAQRVTDALDTYLLAGEIDPTRADADAAVWAHRLVVAEVARREADLDLLLAAVAWSSTVDAVRQEAARSSALPLDRPEPEG